MGIVIDFRTRKRVTSEGPTTPPPVPSLPTQLPPELDDVIRRNLARGATGDTATLIRTIFQLLDVLDLIAVTAECAAIDAGVVDSVEHPLVVIADICHDVLDTEVQL